MDLWGSQFSPHPKRRGRGPENEFDEPPCASIRRSRPSAQPAPPSSGPPWCCFRVAVLLNAEVRSAALYRCGPRAMPSAGRWDVYGSRSENSPHPDEPPSGDPARSRRAAPPSLHELPQPLRIRCALVLTAARRQAQCCVREFLLDTSRERTTVTLCGPSALRVQAPSGTLLKYSCALLNAGGPGLLLGDNFLLRQYKNFK